MAPGSGPKKSATGTEKIFWALKKRNVLSDRQKNIACLRSKGCLFEEGWGGGGQEPREHSLFEKKHRKLFTVPLILFKRRHKNQIRNAMYTSFVFGQEVA